MPSGQRVRIVRIHRRARAANNYDGSLQYANRWNPKGTPMLYASTALSLCCLEMLVHTVDARIIPPGLVWSSADLDDIRPLDLLLNPTHRQYDEIGWSEPQPFPWDRRLIELVRSTPASPADR